MARRFLNVDSVHLNTIQIVSFGDVFTFYLYRLMRSYEYGPTTASSPIPCLSNSPQYAPKVPVHLRRRSARDEEPLVDARVDWCWRLVFTRWNIGGAWVDTIRRVRDGGVGASVKLAFQYVDNIELDLTG